jgi:hypothetical protein
MCGFAWWWWFLLRVVKEAAESADVPFRIRHEPLARIDTLGAANKHGVGAALQVDLQAGLGLIQREVACLVDGLAFGGRWRGSVSVGSRHYSGVPFTFHPPRIRQVAVSAATVGLGGRVTKPSSGLL